MNDQPIIPHRLIIGVTGHRTLENEPALAEQVRRILERIKQLLVTRPGDSNRAVSAFNRIKRTLSRSSDSASVTPIVFTVLSPLAEGADRLVAREILNTPGGELMAVLPLKKADYLQDFQNPQSKEEFEHLLAHDLHFQELASQPTREDAYEQVGRYVVDHCDVLIALWNGEPAKGKGGTADVVAYARQKDVPLFCINPDHPEKVEEKLGAGLHWPAFQRLEQYNRERTRVTDIQAVVDKEMQRLMQHVATSGLPADLLRPTYEALLPHYVRADLLALRYQRRYSRAGDLVYILALSAVIVAAAQVIFHLPEGIVATLVALLEPIFIAAILIIIALGARSKWHTKYLDYRFIAERLRSARFLAVTDIDLAPARPPAHLSLSYSRNDWMLSALLAVWRELRGTARQVPQAFEDLREFVLSAWLNDQIQYHQDKAERSHRRQQQAASIGSSLFALTFVAALFHAAEVVSHDLAEFVPHWLTPVSAFVALVAPAAGAAVGAIRTHREYERTATRSHSMASQLAELRAQMFNAKTREDFLALVCEVDQTMQHEHADWRLLVRFHPLELPA